MSSTAAGPSSPSSLHATPPAHYLALSSLFFLPLLTFAVAVVCPALAAGAVLASCPPSTVFRYTCLPSVARLGETAMTGGTRFESLLLILVENKWQTLKMSPSSHRGLT